MPKLLCNELAPFLTQIFPHQTSCILFIQLVTSHATTASLPRIQLSMSITFVTHWPNTVSVVWSFHYSLNISKLHANIHVRSRLQLSQLEVGEGLPHGLVCILFPSLDLNAHPCRSTSEAGIAIEAPAHRLRAWERQPRTVIDKRGRQRTIYKRYATPCTSSIVDCRLLRELDESDKLVCLCFQQLQFL